MRNRYCIGGALLLVLLWAGAAWAGMMFLSKDSSVGIRFLENGPEKSSLEEAFDGKTQQLSMAAWDYQRDLFVEAPSAGGSAAMDGIFVYGDSREAVFDGLRGGIWKGAFDDDGCMLSEGAAYRLFGSLNVVGLKVICRGREWTIRGVVNKKSPWIMLPAKDKDKLPFMELKFADAENPVSLAEEFLSLNGLSGKYLLFDWPLLKAAVRVLLCLPGWVLGIALLCGWKVKHKWAFAAAAVCMGALLTFRMPQDWIPTRWSEFNFWTSKFEYLGDMLKNLWQARLYDGDLKLAKYFFTAMALSLAACACALSEALLIRGKNE